MTTRVDGLDQLLLRNYDGARTRMPSPKPSYSANFGGNPEFAPPATVSAIRSMVTPATVFDYHPAEHRLEVLKVQRYPVGLRSRRTMSPSG